MGTPALAAEPSVSCEELLTRFNTGGPTATFARAYFKLLTEADPTLIGPEVLTHILTTGNPFSLPQDGPSPRTHISKALERLERVAATLPSRERDALRATLLSTVGELARTRSSRTDRTNQARDKRQHLDSGRSTFLLSPGTHFVANLDHGTIITMADAESSNGLLSGAMFSADDPSARNSLAWNLPASVTRLMQRGSHLVAFSPIDRQIFVHDEVTGVTHKFARNARTRIAALEYDEASNLAVIGFEDSQIYLWKPGEDTSIAFDNADFKTIAGQISAIAIRPGAKAFLTALTTGEVVEWSMTEGRPVHSLSAADQAFGDALISRDGKVLVKRRPDGRLAVSTIIEGESFATLTDTREIRLPESTSFPFGAFSALTNDGSRVAFGLGDEILLVDTRDGSWLVLKTSSMPLNRLAFSSEDRFLFVSNTRGTLDRFTLDDLVLSPK